MAESDFDLRRDELERDNLERAISQVETAKGVSTPGTRSVFEIFLQNAKARLGVLEKKIKAAQEERETHARELAAMGDMADKESRLNGHEKETYRGFLKEDFFTKNDFGRLEEFYKHSWDRLSEHGKDEMSKRVWEGIRNGQYTFAELPPAVREREMKRAYGALLKQSDKADSIDGVSQKDRRDFIRAYESGNQEEAEKILGRESFKNHMFQSPESATRTHGDASVGLDSEKASVVAKLVADESPPKPQWAAEGAKQGDQDLSALDLSGVKLVEADSPASSADIPNARTADRGQGRSTPGS
jgi:hypothetical protein